MMSHLPHDPDGMNDERADWAESAIVLFRHKSGTDKEDACCDLLCDLMHWCDRYGEDFNTEMLRASGHYEAETRSDKENERISKALARQYPPRPELTAQETG